MTIEASIRVEAHFTASVAATVREVAKQDGATKDADPRSRHPGISNETP